MNGSTSPRPPTNSRPTSIVKNDHVGGEHDVFANGHHVGDSLVKASPVRSAGGQAAAGPIAPVEDASQGQSVLINGGGDYDGASEAETLIDSPVKKKEAERANKLIKSGRPAKSRIGSLPVPGDDDDDTTDSHASPMRSVEMTDIEQSVFTDRKNHLVERLDDESDKENSSGSLSSPRSSPSNMSSRSSSKSRALSERPDLARHGLGLLNPRKRKHRASSVNLPNKRSSMEPPRRKLRGPQSEDLALKEERSQSPPAHDHNRAGSTQSAFADGILEGGNRKRRAAALLLAQESKSTRNGSEDSDGSSGSTFHEQNESRRPQRGIGRATSTPGRPPGREHKRHVNKYGFTRLAEACEDGDLELVQEWREKDAEQLELAEFAGNKPLQIAALNGNDEVVKYLIEQGCLIDCANVDKDTPLIDAAENGHLAVVKILLESGVDPLRQNLKGQQALDVVTDDTEDATGIRAVLRQAIGNWNSDDAKRRREQEEEARHAGGPNKELHFMARSYENLLKLVTINDRNGVREFLDARVPVDNALVAAAARTGDEYLVNMLLAEMTDKKAYQKPEKPIIAVLGSSHFDMLKLLTQLGQFNPMYRNRAGKTWPELVEERNGPNCVNEKELLQRLYDQGAATVGRRSSSPVSMRDQGPRRFQQTANDKSSNQDAIAAPKRKHGRRLMSRRDMRAVNGKAMSDSESDESTSGMDAVHEIPEESEEGSTPVMAPTKNPTQSRPSGVDRQRKSSASSQGPESSPGARRRSSTSRVHIDASLPAVAEEKAVDIEMADGVLTFTHAEDTKLAQAQRLEATMKEQEIAEAHTRHVEVEARKADEARRAEEERRAESDRRKHEEAEEAARVAETHRMAAEEQAQRDSEREESWRVVRDKCVDALPLPLALALGPDSHFKYVRNKTQHNVERDDVFLLQRFTPLVSVRETSAVLHPPTVEHWVLNVQIAALLGKKGFDLLVPRDTPGFDRTMSHGWNIYSDFSAVERMVVDRVLTKLCEPVSTGQAAWQPDANAEDKIRATIPLYCVRMSDVQQYLDPIIRDARITLLTQSTSHHHPALANDAPPVGEGFFANFCRATKNRAPVTHYINGRIEDAGSHVLGATSYTVVHDK